MPISPMEQHRRKKLAGAQKTPIHAYLVLDPDFRPNAHGLGGVRTFVKNGKHMIMLTPAQAKYWIDQGAIALEEPAENNK